MLFLVRKYFEMIFGFMAGQLTRKFCPVRVCIVWQSLLPFLLCKGQPLEGVVGRQSHKDGGQEIEPQV